MGDLIDRVNFGGTPDGYVDSSRASSHDVVGLELPTVDRISAVERANHRVGEARYYLYLLGRDVLPNLPPESEAEMGGDTGEQTYATGNLEPSGHHAAETGGFVAED